MAVVPIRIVGDPVLHTPTTPVRVAADGSLPAELAELITDLYDTMDAAYGVGLAANQIGVNLRVFAYDCPDERGQTPRRRGVIVNPVLETSEVPETMPDPDDDDFGGQVLTQLSGATVVDSIHNLIPDGEMILRWGGCTSPGIKSSRVVASDPGRTRITIMGVLHRPIH